MSLDSDESENSVESGSEEKSLFAADSYINNTFFLPWLAERGLLPPPTSGPLSNLPLSVQIDMIKPLANHLSHRKANETQTPVSHVLWTMDCLGQAFTLPMTCEDVISNCLDIYGSWLSGRDSAPRCVRDHPERFFPGIIRHLSLLFQPRESSVSEKEVQLHDYFGQLYSGGGVGSAASRMRNAASATGPGAVRGDRFQLLQASPATRRRTMADVSTSPSQLRRNVGMRNSTSSSPSPAPSPVVSGSGARPSPPPRQTLPCDPNTAAMDESRTHSATDPALKSARAECNVAASTTACDSADVRVGGQATGDTDANVPPTGCTLGDSASSPASAGSSGASRGASPHTLPVLPAPATTAAAKRKTALDQQARAKQVALCRRVLQLLESTLGAHRRGWWTEDVLRVLIGTCDAVASLTGGQSAFADALADDILRTMFMTWQAVASAGAGASLSDNMWALFRTHCTRWRHQVPFVNHWSSATATATDRLLDVTTPCRDTGQHSTENVVASAEERSMAVTVWRRMLCLLGDPATLDSGIKATAMVSLALIIEKLLNVQIECGMPSGNSILDVFRTWLFHAATDAATPKGARQTALSTISRIFLCSNPGSPFKAEFVAQYFYLLTSGLEDAALHEAILLTTNEIFLSNLEGTAVLVRPFLTAVDRVFCQRATDDDSDASLEMLQYAASKLVASLVCMPDVPRSAAANVTDGGPPIAALLMQCCSKGLAVCEDSNTKQILLHAVFLLHIQTKGTTDAPSSCPEHASSPPNTTAPTANATPAPVRGSGDTSVGPPHGGSSVTTAEVIDIILDHLATQTWPAPVTLTAFAILRGYVAMHAHAPTVPLRVVSVVCSYISAQVKQPPHRHTKHLHTMILAGYNCLQYTVTAVPDITRNDDALRSILRAVAMG
eukprot:m.1519177 g.1519177  ORF g.1519177 m.1519177 type:complete len:901 (-) comp25223_c0_seq12:152-2854(-)